MKPSGRSTESWWSLTVDLLSARVLVWSASVGRDADLTPEGHLYFFDRYHRLAEYHRARGRLTRAVHYDRKADDHYDASGADDGPPYAAAMAMPRPRHFVRVNALADRQRRGYDDAA